jgi:hypothetical protein
MYVWNTPESVRMQKCMYVFNYFPQLLPRTSSRKKKQSKHPDNLHPPHTNSAENPSLPTIIFVAFYITYYGLPIVLLWTSPAVSTRSPPFAIVYLGSEHT